MLPFNRYRALAPCLQRGSRATIQNESRVTGKSFDTLRIVERPRSLTFLPEGFASSKTYSEKKADQIDDEVTRVIEEAHQRVRGILSTHRKVLDDLARLLSREEIVQGETLRKMLGKPPADTLPVLQGS